MEKDCYTAVVDFKKDLKEAGSQKQLLNFIKSGMVEQAKTRDSNAMDINAAQSGNNKCFNCGGEHCYVSITDSQEERAKSPSK